MWKHILGTDAPARERELVALYEEIPPERRPRHIAIIMDGNGRWAEGRGLLRTAGHRAGVQTVRRVLETSIELGLEVLTVYAFSTENWKRPRPEVDFLLSLFSEYLDKELQEMHENHVRLRFLGREEGLPAKLLGKMHEAVRLMQGNDGIRFNIAANYGGQDELLRVAQKLASRVARGELAPEGIDASVFEAELDTAGDPPVDLVLRTSGAERLSNFLLWQTAYAEFYFTETNWPDFTAEEYVAAIREFAQRKRRFGGLDKRVES